MNEKLARLNNPSILYSALYERMRADQRKFGKSAWAAAVDRMERLQYAVSKETLQLMRAKEICLEERKHSLKEEVRRLVVLSHVCFVRGESLCVGDYDLTLQPRSPGLKWLK